MNNFCEMCKITLKALIKNLKNQFIGKLCLN